MLFDTHAHYGDSAFDEDRDTLLGNMKNENVGLIVNLGDNLTSSKEAVALADRYPFIYAAVGIHPSDIATLDEEAIRTLRTLAQNPKVKAIGEIGLDYYWEDYAPHEVQKAGLRRQMELARELNLPVVIHDREAHGDTMAIVREFPDVRGEFHCYSGAIEDAKELVKRGWYLGFNGSITFKNARKAPEVIAWMPADKILIETDCPYLAPVPFRGKRNNSALTALVVEKIAEIRGVDKTEIEQITYENGKRFFNIEE